LLAMIPRHLINQINRSEVAKIALVLLGHNKKRR
jgi:hypothetical protein